MGTPDFAVPTLQMLIDEKHEIELVVTQPDRPKGRGNKETMSPIKILALEHNLKISQPERIKNDPEFIEYLANINPDLIIVVAFGQILPKEILDIPALGCINVHGSLLPKYRGAAPIQWSVIDGEKETGVTIMYMDEGLDTGDMLYKKIMPIEESDTAGSIFDKMKIIGAQALKEAFPLIISGGKEREAQQNSLATIAPRINKALGAIDFSKSAQSIKNLINGLQPWPVAYFTYNEQVIKVFTADVVHETSEFSPGIIVRVDKNGLLVQTGSEMLLIKEIQVPNKKRMQVSEYIKGHTIEVEHDLSIV